MAPKKAPNVKETVEETKALLSQATSASAWNPFRIYRLAKSCRHLLKPSPFAAAVIVIFAGLMDILQIILDLAYQSGVLINRFLDIAFAAILALIFWLCGASFAKNWSNIMGMLVSMVLEQIPDVDALPFWFLDAMFSVGNSWLPIIAGEEERVRQEEEDKRQEAIRQERSKMALEAHVNDAQNPGGPRQQPSPNVIQRDFSRQGAAAPGTAPAFPAAKSAPAKPGIAA